MQCSLSPRLPLLTMVNIIMILSVILTRVVRNLGTKKQCQIGHHTRACPTRWRRWIERIAMENDELQCDNNNVAEEGQGKVYVPT